MRGFEKRVKTNTSRYGRPFGPTKDTWIEIEAKKVFSNVGMKYEDQFGFCGTVVDFILREHMLVVEVDGCYWHNCQICYPGKTPFRTRAQKEIMIAAAIAAKGYRLLRVWEHDMKNFKSILLAFIGEK